MKYEKIEQNPKKVELHPSFTACMIRPANEKRMFARDFQFFLFNAAMR